MLKILHTADWHIGQNFFGYDRKEEHIAFFAYLKGVVKEHRPDVLLVAGDIFDNPNPSAESQKIYYHFLRDLTAENPALQIVITAGNHDSAARLEAPTPLLEGMNIYVKGLVSKNSDGEIDYKRLFVPLYKESKIAAWCIAVPYLRQGDYPNAESYSNGIKAMYDTLYSEIQKIKDKEVPIVMMGHLQATGSEVSEDDRSERTIIGGLEVVSPEVFDKKDIVYTALGHLHKAQRVSNRENIRYSGSPLPMSFAEKNYKKGVNLIIVDGCTEPKIERIEFDPPVKLLSIPLKPQILNEVLYEIAKLPDGEIKADSPYLEIKVLITEPEPSMRYQIEEALKGKSVRLASAVPHRVKRNTATNTISYEELKVISPIVVANDVFMRKYGSEMPDSMKDLLKNVIEEANQ